MPEDTLYTLRQISQELDLPESTVRYYRDSFSGYLPTVGTGRRRRYPPRAVAMLRVVAEGYANNRSRAEIETQVGAMPGEPIEAEPFVSYDVGSDETGRSDDEWIPKYIDGERERRDAMWHMAREIVRLGEAIDRQQVMLGNLAKQLSESANRTLPTPQPREGPEPAVADQTRRVPDSAPERRPDRPAAPAGAEAPEPQPAPHRPTPPLQPDGPSHLKEEQPHLHSAGGPGSHWRPVEPPENHRPPHRAPPARPQGERDSMSQRTERTSNGEYDAEMLELREQLARERELVERLRRSKLEIERRAADAEYRLGDQEPGPQRRGSLFTKFFNRD